MYFQKVFTDANFTAGQPTQVIPLDWRNGPAGLRIGVTGTVNYTLEQTFDDIQFKAQPFTWHVEDPATQQNQTTSQTIYFAAHPKAIRLMINSFSAGATITLSYTQIDM